jgi:hypothetical protein
MRVPTRSLVVWTTAARSRGELVWMRGRYEFGGVVFDVSDVDELEDVT